MTPGLDRQIGTISATRRRAGGWESARRATGATDAGERAAAWGGDWR